MLMNSINIRSVIVESIDRILTENGKSTNKILDIYRLTEDIGLDSLSLAGLYIALEDALRVDLLSERIDIVDIRTVGDLVRAYQRVLSTKEIA